MATLNTRLQMIAQQTIQNRLKNAKAGNVAQTSLNNKTKTAVDEVKLTVVNSKSGFDKYVETLENGKKSVASSFINTLENYIGDFAKGIVSATQDEAPATKETKEDDVQNKIQENVEKSYNDLTKGNDDIQSINWTDLKNKFKGVIDKKETKQTDNDTNTTDNTNVKDFVEKELDKVKDTVAKMDKTFDVQNKLQEDVEKSYKYLNEENNGLQSVNWTDLRNKFKNAINKNS